MKLKSGKYDHPNCVSRIKEIQKLQLTFFLNKSIWSKYIFLEKCTDKMTHLVHNIHKVRLINL